MSLTHERVTAKNPFGVANGLVIFAHIPKTAGSTINKIIDVNYEQIFNFYPRKNEPLSQLKDWIADFQAGMERLQQNPQPKLLRGHFGLGIHDLLGIDRCAYITLLRDPVERVISHYYFLEQVEKFFAPATTDSQTAEKMTLEKFIYQRKDPIVNNLQTRFLSGIGWQKSYYKDLWKKVYKQNFKVGYGDCTEEMLSRAKYNLENYVVFGLQSRFNESLDLFKTVFGWQDVNFELKKNVNKQRPAREQIDPDLINFIQRENHLDTELHNYALEIFDRTVARLQVKPKIVDKQTIWFYPAIPQNKSNKGNNMNAFLDEADRLFESGHYPEAINKYKEIIKTNPEYIPALFKLALSYNKINESDREIAVYERILELKPNRDKALAKLARLQASQNDYDSAIANFKKAISLNQNQPDWVFISLGNALKRSKNVA